MHKAAWAQSYAYHILRCIGDISQCEAHAGLLLWCYLHLRLVLASAGVDHAGSGHPTVSPHMLFCLTFVVQVAQFPSTIQQQQRRSARKGETAISCRATHATMRTLDMRACVFLLGGTNHNYKRKHDESASSTRPFAPNPRDVADALSVLGVWFLHPRQITGTAL